MGKPLNLYSLRGFGAAGRLHYFGFDDTLLGIGHL